MAGVAKCYRSAGIVLVLAFLLGVCLAATRPQQVNRFRRSGISDQRLAELETLIALARLKGRTRAITNPIAFGVIDPDKIGRRKRRSLSYDELINILEELQNQLSILEEDEETIPPPTPPFSPSGDAGREDGRSMGRVPSMAKFLRPRRRVPGWPVTA